MNIAFASDRARIGVGEGATLFQHRAEDPFVTLAECC